MFGRVRAASLDSLELERPLSSKIIKDDPLSIYEITLQKLRLGSRRALIPSSSTDTLNASPTKAKSIDAPPSSADTLKASSTEAMKIDAPPPLSTSTPSSCCIGESIHICSEQMVDCTSFSESKCKRGLWIHHDFGVVSINLESQPLGQKV
ncbi:hypothetical protein MKW94_026690 [Papaver nudicaule]|uniref:Uncharacterized protein n=1 Tax=Papaver nudicaule TaxID=74823 RepID=A0AA41V9M5_PAPNU|nr:hypothetical protein [Papaver nudicaule]